MPLIPFFVSSSLKGVPSLWNFDLHLFLQCFPFLHWGHNPGGWFFFSLFLKVCFLFYTHGLYALVSHKKSINPFGVFLPSSSEHRRENVDLALLQYRPFLDHCCWGIYTCFDVFLHSPHFSDESTQLLAEYWHFPMQVVSITCFIYY